MIDARDQYVGEGGDGTDAELPIVGADQLPEAPEPEPEPELEEEDEE